MIESLSIASVPEKLSGSIDLPSSKSLSNRALIIKALGHLDNTRLLRLSESNDTKVLQRLIREMDAGAETLNVEDAGTAARFITAYACSRKKECTITGTERMQQRPIAPLVEALNSLGASIKYLGNEGYLPVKLSGQPIDGNSCNVRRELSSQFVSALMMIGPMLPQGLAIGLSGKPSSQPYIDMTSSLMQELGAKLAISDEEIKVMPVPYTGPLEYEVEADWSAAIYYKLLAAFWPSQKLRLKGLKANSLQGDARILALLNELGMRHSFDEDGLEIQWGQIVADRIDYDFTDQPDLAQPLAAFAVAKGLSFRFNGLHTLRLKESDRIQALHTELSKAGGELRSGTDWLECNTVESREESIIYQTYQDHRMAMSLSLLCFKNPRAKILDPMVVSKSNPNFWKHLSQLGFTLK